MDTSKSYKAPGTQEEENFLYLEKEEHTHWRLLCCADLSVASGTAYVKVKENWEKKSGYIYTTKNERAGGRELEQGSAQSFGMKKRKKLL